MSRYGLAPHMNGAANSPIVRPGPPGRTPRIAKDTGKFNAATASQTYADGRCGSEVDKALRPATYRGLFTPGHSSRAILGRSGASRSRWILCGANLANGPGKGTALFRPWPIPTRSPRRHQAQLGPRGAVRGCADENATTLQYGPVIETRSLSRHNVAMVNGQRVMVTVGLTQTRVVIVGAGFGGGARMLNW